MNNWGEVGIRIKLRPMERAAYIKAFAEKTYKNVIQAGPAGFGNAATRLETHAVQGGTFTYGSYPDLDALFAQQAGELNYKRREAILHQMQQIVHERAIYAPIWQLAFINGVGPRVAEFGLRADPGLSLHGAVRRAGAEGGIERRQCLRAIRERRLALGRQLAPSSSARRRYRSPTSRAAVVQQLDA